MIRRTLIVFVLIVANVIYSRYDVANRSHLHKIFDSTRGYFSPLMTSFHPALTFNDSYRFRVGVMTETNATIEIKCTCPTPHHIIYKELWDNNGWLTLFKSN